MRKKNGEGYDKVMRMAVHLDKKLDPNVAFTDAIPDSRWGKENELKKLITCIVLLPDQLKTIHA